MPEFLVGIDLGTTHTVVAYSPIDRTDIRILDIEQLVAPGEVAARPLLPSVRYHPATGELSDADLAFLVAEDKAVIGEAARVLGAKTQGRLVTSAKSWLSHPSVDHSAAVLPWGGGEHIAKVSPLAASAGYLSHIRSVWRHKFPAAPLEQQEIVITVPASFDEGARSLTLAAAKMAGLHRVKLLEEPQAVFYDWLRTFEKVIKQQLADVHLLLVCDVGGGTTDLTLIRVEQAEPEPKLTRIGVGDHLMLGGDNIDLALAHLAEQRLAGGERRLSAADMSQLIEQCRSVKEKLLADDAPEQLNVTLLGGGAKLIGGSRSVALTREEVRAIALDGFFPLSGLDELPDRKRSGVVEFGLPYAAEPAVSKHIAAFLKRHQQAAREALDDESCVPDALLLNGGVFRSQAISQRALDLLKSWRGDTPKLLENRHPELAVALGAVSYALARRNQQIRIGGGAARSYFLLVDTQVDERQGVCILPRGSEEGHEVLLQTQQFALRLGQPVRFHLASTTDDRAYKAGDLAIINDEQFHLLPPLAVAFAGTDNAANTEVIVQLAATQTEIGTVKIQCVAVADSDRRWDVEFQIRTQGAPTLSVQADLPLQFNAAVELIQAVYGAKSRDINPKAVKSLRADLEKILAAPRSEWQTPLLRGLFAAFLEGAKYRRRSENHERVWLSLTGFCLRPGFGYPLDDWRVEQLWKNYDQGIQFVNETQNWSEWWTLWRRIAGGLDGEAQQCLFNDIAKFLNPATARQPGVAKQIKSRGYDDMVRLSAALERLPVANKRQLGEWLLKRLQKASEPDQTWWAVGRIGARIPFHGSSHNVIAPTLAALWLQQIMKADWKKSPQAGFAATLIARKSGDRARDIDETLRLRIVEQLKAAKLPASWVDMVETLKELEREEEKQIFGEALPPGLKLLV
ncbi:MAG: molecular chaperone DnaK [Gammaproteobacteria bacterium HGW-Gammaproteobacteria-3]|nr:MAG: molecular chaperone DnaK [Gammaproteobacteria bacterium HGW-Gammaproteobacteria-3]